MSVQVPDMRRLACICASDCLVAENARRESLFVVIRTPCRVIRISVSQMSRGAATMPCEKWISNVNERELRHAGLIKSGDQYAILCESSQCQRVCNQTTHSITELRHV